MLYMYLFLFGTHFIRCLWTVCVTVKIELLYLVMKVLLFGTLLHILLTYEHADSNNGLFALNHSPHATKLYLKLKNEGILA